MERIQSEQAGEQEGKESFSVGAGKVENLSCLCNIISSSVFKELVADKVFLSKIFSFLDICEEIIAAVGGDENENFKIIIFQIFEQVASDQESIFAHSDLFIKSVLPYFLSNIVRYATSYPADLPPASPPTPASTASASLPTSSPN